MTRNHAGAPGPSARIERDPIGTVRVGDVPIRHAEKAWWPEEGITKLDVARFYARVAPHILPWMKGRPLVVERCPDGIRGECFFQKDFARGAPEGVPRAAMYAESTGGTVSYVVGGAKGTLLHLVNLGCIAMHVMNCRAETPERPDWLAFDLDPSTGRFADAARIGQRLRALLDELRIRSYPKTSGGRGLHVLVPLRAGPSQDAARAFARYLAEQLVTESPELATLEMSKRARGARVFVDVLRNAFGQTLAAPYSVRRRPGAPVSTPLAWDEVDPALDPGQFNLQTIERRLGAEDPWEGFWHGAQRLPAV